MLEILVMLAFFVLFAKKGARSRNFRYLPVQMSHALAGLGALDLNGTAFGTNFDRDHYLISAKGLWGKFGGTVGEGPIAFGIAHSDYSDAEIEEAIEAGASWDRSDKILNEQRRRFVRVVGQFPQIASDEVFADGRSVKTPLRWVQEVGTTFKIFAYNLSGGGVTPGTTIVFTGGLNAKVI